MAEPLALRITIGEAARRAGLSARAIRFYEARGLLATPRDRNAVRYYDAAILTRLEHIAFMRRGGFSLKEIAELLETRERHGVAAFNRRTAEILARRISALDHQRRELESMMSAVAPAARSIVA